MQGKVLIVGGAGQIGHAVAAALLADGWRVIVSSRSGAGPAPAGGELVACDRDQPGALAGAVGEGVDALIDVAAYDADHARQLLEVQADVGAFVVISSASVYRDAVGRTLDEAASGGFPELPVPIAADQPTVDPGPDTYSTRKVALEQALLQHVLRPTTILRRGAIHGLASRHSREWFFVKRILDRRSAVPLAYMGESRFHTTAAANIAELVRIALARPGVGALNIADPVALSVSEIGRAIAASYGRTCEIVPFAGPPQVRLGAHPWCVPAPIVLDMSRAAAIGYRPAVTYEQSVGEDCRSIEAMAASGAIFPDYINAMFDYAAEDAWLARSQA